MKGFETKEEAHSLLEQHLVEIGGKIFVGKGFFEEAGGNSKRRKKEVQKSEIEELADKILSLPIPNHKVSGSSVSFKPNRTDLEDKLLSFYQRYQYEYTVVYEAVKDYVEEVISNPNFKQALKNFIIITKDGVKTSSLADYCEKVVNGENNQKEEKIDYSKYEI